MSKLDNFLIRLESNPDANALPQLLKVIRIQQEALENIQKEDKRFIESATMDWDGVMYLARQALEQIEELL